MPAARGLFHRAILQSGAAQHVSPPEDAARIAGHLADLLEVDPDRDAIAAAGVGRLLAAQAQLKADLLGDPDPARWGTSVVTTTMPWQPVVDGDVLPGPPAGADRHRVRRRVSTSWSGPTSTTGGSGSWSAGPSGRSPTRSSPVRSRTYGYQSLAAYGLDPATRAGRLPAPVPRGGAG